MRIQIVGGGPGGLYFGLLMKQLDPSCDITVFERDGADQASGWGIAFAEQAFGYLRDTDRVVYDRVRERAVYWNHLDIVHRGEHVRVWTRPSAGLTRLALLDLLRRRAAEVGLTLRFGAAIRDLRALPDADLVVGADGANSLVRQTFSASFQPDLRIGRNKFAWLGVRHRLDGQVTVLRSAPTGVFAAHLYPHSETSSTAIIECAEPTWSQAGLDVKTDHEALVFLSDLFAPELGGHLLLTNDRMKWRNFLVVANERWVHDDRVVLLGDALRTVHFSTNAGVRLAVEDAIALWRALRQGRTVADALATYETTRRAETGSFLDIARRSLEWFEHLDRLAPLEPSVVAREFFAATNANDSRDAAVSP